LQQFGSPTCRYIHTDHAVLASRSFFAGSDEAVEPMVNRNRRETRRLKNADHLCFQQSAGDSTRPEIDIG
jgi:hypothetical protein